MTKVMIPFFGWIYQHIVTWNPSDIRQLQQSGRQCGYRAFYSNDQEEFRLDKRIGFGCQIRSGFSTMAKGV